MCDILMTPLAEQFVGKYNVCVDKGTYDAISLNKANNDDGELRRCYRTSVHAMLKDSDQSLFFITSCNWTEQELVSFFSPYFKVRAVLPTPKFQFGGVTGNNVTSIVFEKTL